MPREPREGGSEGNRFPVSMSMFNWNSVIWYAMGALRRRRVRTPVSMGHSQLCRDASWPYSLTSTSTTNLNRLPALRFTVLLSPQPASHAPPPRAHHLARRAPPHFSIFDPFHHSSPQIKALGELC